MDASDMKQTCLILQDAAGKLHDIVDIGGLSAPLDDLGSIMLIKNIVDATEILHTYFEWENVVRMLKMGVDPADLTRLIKE